MAVISNRYIYTHDIDIANVSTSVMCVLNVSTSVMCVLNVSTSVVCVLNVSTSVMCVVLYIIILCFFVIFVGIGVDHYVNSGCAASQ